MLAVAMRKAVINRGVSVVVLPGDVALKAAPGKRQQPLVSCAAADGHPGGRRAAQAGAAYSLLQQYRAHVRQRLRRRPPELVEFAAKIKAPIVHALRGKEHVEYDNPYDVGMTGLIGFSSGFHTMMNADTLILLGTQFPIAPSTQPTRKLSRSTSTPAASAHTVRSTWRWWAILNRR